MGGTRWPLERWLYIVATGFAISASYDGGTAVASIELAVENSGDERDDGDDWDSGGDSIGRGYAQPDYEPTTLTPRNSRPRRIKRQDQRREADAPVEEEDSGEASVEAAPAPGSSAANRRTRKHQVGLLVPGAADYFLTQGVQYEYLLGPDLHLGGFLLGGSGSLPFAEYRNSFVLRLDATTVDYLSLSTAFYARYFTGNSFNLTAGLGVRSLQFKWPINATFYDSNLDPFSFEVDASVDLQAIVISYGFGNQWTWKSGFTFGFDWLVGMSSVASETRISTSAKNLNQQDTDKLTDVLLSELQSSAGGNTFLVLMANLAWTF